MQDEIAVPHAHHKGGTLCDLGGNLLLGEQHPSVDSGLSAEQQLMLVAMTYNTFLFTSIIIGAFVGHILYEGEIDVGSV